MKFSTFISSVHDLDLVERASCINEVLLESRRLSRLGKLTREEVFHLAREAKRRGLHVVLVWDLLMTENCFESSIAELSGWDLNSFDAIRLADIGAAQWLFLHHPKMKIQLILEGGSHNKDAILTWSHLLSPNLEKLVFSIQLPEEKLLDYCRSVSVRCEILGAGRTPLLHTPRYLLKEHIDDDSEEKEAFIYSEESNFREFLIVENDRGTTLFSDKDHFILDSLENIRSCERFDIRIDLRELSKRGNAADNIDIICTEILKSGRFPKEQWPKNTQKSFFKTNKTTVLFSKIRSKRRQKRDERALAEILYSRGGSSVIFRALRDFEHSSIAGILLPSGKRIAVPDYFKMETLEGEELDFVEVDRIFRAPWFKYAASGTLLIKDEDEL